MQRNFFKDIKSENLTDLILNEKMDSLFVALLQDQNGNRSHAVGIDVGKQSIYDCMEENALVLNKNNSSILCRGNAVFCEISIADELEKYYKRQKLR